MAYLLAGEWHAVFSSGTLYMFSSDDYNCKELSLLILQAVLLDIEEYLKNPGMSIEDSTEASVITAYPSCPHSYHAITA